MGTSKHSAQDISDAITMLDIYASQRAWSGTPFRHEHTVMTMVLKRMGASPGAYELGTDAWHMVQINKENHDLDLYECAAEGAQRLREGWRP